MSPVLTHCLVELTGRCNLSCKHCYASALRREDISLPTLLAQLLRLSSSGLARVTLSGGEPLLHEGAVEAMAQLRNASVRVSLNTNGTLIDAAVAGRIAELKLDSVYISLLGARPGTHDRICGVPGAFARVVRASDLLARRGVPVTVRFSVLPDNYTELHAVARLAAVVGAKDLVINPAFLPSCEPGGSVAGSLLDDVSLTWVLTNIGSEPARPKGMCPAGVSYCAISPEGDILPCHLIRTATGNVFREGLAATWHESESLKELRAIRPNDHLVCSQCPHWGVSCTRRPCHAYLATGSITAPDPYACRTARLLADPGLRSKRVPPAVTSPCL